MKRSILAVSLLALLYACSESTTTGVVETVEEAEETTASLPTAELGQGKLLYEGKCGTCHKLKPVDNYTSEQWDKILPNMAKKAKLEADQTSLIHDYVKWEIQN